MSEIHSHCPLCHISHENKDHLFQGSSFTHHVIQYIARFYHISWSHIDLGSQWFPLLRKINKTHPHHVTIALYTMWHIWKARNLAIFHYAPAHPQHTSTQVIHKALHYISSNQLISRPKWVPMQHTYYWQPPPCRYKLNIDGSHNGHCTGIGAWFINENGDFFAGMYANVGTATISTAEMWPAREGLYKATQLGIAKLNLESNSNFVVHLLPQNWAPPFHLKSLL